MTEDEVKERAAGVHAFLNCDGKADAAGDLCAPETSEDTQCEEWPVAIARQVALVETQLKRPELVSDVARARDLLRLHSELSSKKEKSDAPRFNGFYLHPQLLLYAWMLTLLGGLLVMRLPRHSVRVIRTWPRWAEIGVLGLLLFLAVRWPHIGHWWWAVAHRGELDDARRVYSFVHGDLFFYSFAWNQISFWLVCTIIAWLCYVWLDAAVDTEEGPDPDLLESARELSREFHAWKLSSAAIALTFLYGSVLYWRLIWRVGDMRYLPSALLIHALWAFAWFCASAPLMAKWDRWHDARKQFLMSPNSDGKVLEYLEPISVLSLTGSVVVATASFFAPVVHALLQLP